MLYTLNFAHFGDLMPWGFLALVVIMPFAGLGLYVLLAEYRDQTRLWVAGLLWLVSMLSLLHRWSFNPAPIISHIGDFDYHTFQTLEVFVAGIAFFLSWLFHSPSRE